MPKTKPTAMSKAFPLLLVLGIFLALAACSPATQSGPLPDPATFRPAPGEVFSGIEAVGDMGLWMITKELKNATWLGEKYQGRILREPINVILIDQVASTPEQAAERLLSAMIQAGYGPKSMHSSGYYGYLNGELKKQFPQGQGEAFSDGPWYKSNNHGRAFGPFKTVGGYVFIAAFSRENFRLLPKPGHPYSSFMAAREDLAQRLTANTSFKQKRYVDLHSRVDTPTETTADHDGRAVMLVAMK